MFVVVRVPLLEPSYSRGFFYSKKPEKKMKEKAEAIMAEPTLLPIFAPFCCMNKPGQISVSNIQRLLTSHLYTAFFFLSRTTQRSPIIYLWKVDKLVQWRTRTRPLKEEKGL
jgi:hypothetical protein